VVFESGLQMLADSPSNYRQSPECTALMAAIPTTWDETRVLEAELGEVLVLARRKGSQWYLAGMTRAARTVTLDLSFLQGEAFTLLRDGPNAHRFAEDYVLEDRSLESPTLEITLAPGGGFVLIGE
jgi:alpha-glucosidase